MVAAWRGLVGFAGVRRHGPGCTASPRTAASTPSGTPSADRPRPAVRAARALASRGRHLAAAPPWRLARPCARSWAGSRGAQSGPD